MGQEYLLINKEHMNLSSEKMPKIVQKVELSSSQSSFLNPVGCYLMVTLYPGFLKIYSNSN